MNKHNLESNLNSIEKIKEKYLNKERLNWMDYYTLAKAYYDHHGNLDIKTSFRTFDGYQEDKDGIKLGTWISTQRLACKGYEYCELSKEKIALLNNLEMIWDYAIYAWNKHYNLAKAYYEHHGNLNVPGDFKTINGYEYDETGFTLGDWLKIQKAAYNGKIFYNQTEEQIRLLNAIGIVWESGKEYNWNQKYQLAKEYYNHYGTSNMSVRYKDKNGTNVGSWLDTQRQKYVGKGQGMITDEQIKLLDDIEFNWFKKSDEKYQKELITSKNTKRKQIEILNRFRTVLNKMKIDNLPTTEILNQAFLTELENIKGNKGGSNWYRNYFLTKAYYNHYGTSDVSTRYRDENETNIRGWLDTQRKKYVGRGPGELTNEQIKLLDDIEFNWFKRSEEKYQKEIITPENKGRKKTEITNRVKTYLNKLESDNLPSKEEITQSFIDQLNKKYVKVKK